MLKPWVIKAGGELMADSVARKNILRDLKALSRRHAIVFVHGGGPQIEKELVRNKIPVKFINGRRFTSPHAMTIVEQVLSGSINKGIVGELNAKGVKAVGLSGRDAGLIKGQPIKNLGRAAKPVKVNVKLLLHLMKIGFLPLVSSVGADVKGQAVNINADDAASALAIALKAWHLVFLTNISGVKDRDKNTIRHLKIAAIEKLISAGVITGGMIPKVQSARSAILKGVKEINIVNGFKGIRLATGTALVR